MRQPPIPPTPTDTSLAGKTAIITGGNSGLGFEAARQFLTLRAARVIITVRSKSKGEEAVAALRADPAVRKANPDAIIEAFDLDLDDYQSGLSFAQKVRQEVKQLDILLCNGGLHIVKYQTSKSGHERVMQVNCYTHFLVALELLPLLRATAATRRTPSRLTFVGSYSQNRHTMTTKPVTASETVLGHFDDRKVYDGFKRYMDSKLILYAFVARLATAVPSSEVIVNDLCPGIVATGFDRDLPIWLKSFMFLLRKAFARSVEDGGRTLIYATAVAGPETHGKFLSHNEINPGTPFLSEPTGKEFAERLWTEIIADVGKIDPGLKVSV